MFNVTTGKLVYIDLSEVEEDIIDLLDSHCDMPLLDYCFDHEELSGLMANVAEDSDTLANALADVLEQHPNARYIFTD